MTWCEEGKDFLIKKKDKEPASQERVESLWGEVLLIHKDEERDGGAPVATTAKLEGMIAMPKSAWRHPG